MNKRHIIAVSMAVIVMTAIFYCFYKLGHNNRTTTLRQDYRLRTQNIIDSTKQEISRIEEKAMSEIRKERDELKRIEQRIAELQRRKGNAEKALKILDFIDKKALCGLVEDFKRIEQSYIAVGEICRRIRALHMALGKSESDSQEMNFANNMYCEIKTVYQQVVQDMESAFSIFSKVEKFNDTRLTSE